MKMNDTVARIVEIMFQDVEQNEETVAIRDEVMNNCQERFTDMVASGISEDDAIAAVIESLKGMEEVLAPYKKKASRTVSDMEDMDDLEDEESGERNMAFQAAEIHQINVCLVSEVIELEASDDDNYHVIWDSKENPQMRASVHNGTLNIDRRPCEEAKPNKDSKVEMNYKGDMPDFIKTEDGKIEINMDGFESAMKSLGEKIKMTFSNGLGIRFGTAGGLVTIQIPENAIPHVMLQTTSGDIRVQDVALTDLTITTTSGDIEVDLDENQRLESIETRTTSGDMEVNTHADRASVASTSGDVEVNGRYDKLSIGTISGDIDLRADVVNVNFSAISGDVDLRFESDEIRKVSGSTVSGDIEIELPEGIGTLAIQTQTRSGDVTTRCHTNGVGPTVTGGVSSMSGDITIR